MKTAAYPALLKPIRKLFPPARRQQEPAFWQLFALSLGMSLLMTGLAVLAQRLMRKGS